jgi:hypothetical protein
MIISPYHHFCWGDGWSYVPPPSDPYPPQSGKMLGQFEPDVNGTQSQSPMNIPPSSFGDGSRRADNNYWFSATTAWVGCDNGSNNLSDTCDFVATSYQWDEYTQTEVVAATQHFKIPPCPNLVQCQLSMITFNYLFYKMTALSFYANVQGQISGFWIDSIGMDWYNNTCAAGQARISNAPAKCVGAF